MTEYRVELTDEQARQWERDFPSPARGHERSTSWLPAYILADAIRANPPKPPRIAEPGFGESVWARITSDEGRRRFVRTTGSYPWRDEYGAGWRWDQLLAPEPWRPES